MAASNNNSSSSSNSSKLSKNKQQQQQQQGKASPRRNPVGSVGQPRNSPSQGTTTTAPLSCCSRWFPSCCTTSCSAGSKKKSCCLFLCMIGRLVLILSISIGIVFLADKFSLSSKYLEPLTLSFIAILKPIVNISTTKIAQTNIHLFVYCLGTFLILPVICHSLVVLVGGEALQLSGIREQRERIGGVVKRAAMAQQNFVEGLVLLLTAIAVATRASVKEEVILANVSLYLLWRRVYLLAYLLNLSCLRAIMFITGLLTLLRMMVSSLF